MRCRESSPDSRKPEGRLVLRLSPEEGSGSLAPLSSSWVGVGAETGQKEEAAFFLCQPTRSPCCLPLILFLFVCVSLTSFMALISQCLLPSSLTPLTLISLSPARHLFLWLSVSLFPLSFSTRYIFPPTLVFYFSIPLSVSSLFAWSFISYLLPVLSPQSFLLWSQIALSLQNTLCLPHPHALCCL